MRADPGALAAPEGDEVAQLLDDARRWHRVRSGDLLDPADFLRRLLHAFLGVATDGPGGRLELAPYLPDEWRAFAVRRLRVHRTLLDIEVKRRAEWVTVRLAVMFGPPLAVRVRLPEDEPVGRIAVDEIPLEGDAAIFTAAGEHEVTLYRGVASPSE